MWVDFLFFLVHRCISLHQNIPWRTFCIDAAEDPILNIAPRDFLHNIVYSVHTYIMSTNHLLFTFKASEDLILNIAPRDFVHNIVYSVHNYIEYKPSPVYF